MLVSMRDITRAAHEGNYCVMAPNVSYEIEARAAIEAAEEVNAPIILDFVYGVHPDILFLGNILTRLAEQSSVPVAVNQDHGACMEHNIAAIRAGFTGIMVDRSLLPYEENVRQVREMTEIAHGVGVGVEGELGHVGANDESMEDSSMYTDPTQAKSYVESTGIDQLAISIGTAHGPYKGKPNLRFDILEDIKNTVDIPLVLHGSSGTGDDLLSKACQMGINKMNIYTDLLIGAIKETQKLDLAVDSILEFYPRITKGYKTRLLEVLEFSGSCGKAWNVRTRVTNRKVVFEKNEVKQSF